MRYFRYQAARDMHCTFIIAKAILLLPEIIVSVPIIGSIPLSTKSLPWNTLITQGAGAAIADKESSLSAFQSYRSSGPSELVLYYGTIP